MMKHEPLLLGWCEWVGLSEIGLSRVRAKFDTGARTSALHTYELETVRQGGQACVRFIAHPLFPLVDSGFPCCVPITDERWIINPSGHRERRYIITTALCLSGRSWPIEVSLTNREHMRFPLIIGRSALKRRVLINPGKRYTLEP